MKVLVPLPAFDFDPTEVAIFWKILNDRGLTVVFATPQGRPGKADELMLTGKGLGPLSKLLMADRNALKAYQELTNAEEFNRPLAWSQVQISEYDGLYFPGGHKKEGMRPYLESEELMNWCRFFFEHNRPVGAVCHGVLIPARAKDPKTGKSLLYHRQTTALVRSGERTAYHLTKFWVGEYYLTYPSTTVEDEVKSILADPHQFLQGPPLLFRDNMQKLNRGFIVEDGNFISGRWPGDVHRLATQFANKLVHK